MEREEGSSENTIRIESGMGWLCIFLLSMYLFNAVQGTELRGFMVGLYFIHFRGSASVVRPRGVEKHQSRLHRSYASAK